MVYLADLFQISQYDGQPICERYRKASGENMPNYIQINLDDNWKIFEVSKTYIKCLIKHMFSFMND